MALKTQFDIIYFFFYYKYVRINIINKKITMSIIDHLLVLLDEGKIYTLSEIEENLQIFKYKKQVISASLGRTYSKNLINKIKKNQFKISKQGQLIVTDTLDNIQRFKNRNISANVLFITFNIPEKERTNRDIMRTYLTNNSYGRLHNTVWIGLNINENKLLKFITDLNINKQVLYFNAKLDNNNLKNVIENINWNFDKINLEYRNFVSSANKFLNKNNKNKFHARSLVYQFAKIAKKDPILPDNMLSANYLGQTAFETYEAIREFCY